MERGHVAARERSREADDAGGELRCDVTALGAVYLGGFTWEQLVRGGRVEELKRGAAAKADAIFGVAGAPRGAPRSSETPRRAARIAAPGRLAQLGEHQLDKLGVTGSSPVPPTS